MHKSESLLGRAVTVEVSGFNLHALGATHQGAELDLLIIEGDRRIGVEFKYTDVPRFTRSMRIAMTDLKLEFLSVVYPG